MKKKDVVYYARIIPNVGIYDVCELTIRSVEDTWFVGVDKHDKHAYLLNNKEIGKTVFTDRKDALEIVRNAEENRPEVVNTDYYENQEWEIEND